MVATNHTVGKNARPEKRDNYVSTRRDAVVAIVDAAAMANDEPRDAASADWSVHPLDIDQQSSVPVEGGI